MARRKVSHNGLSVVYEPKNRDPIVDIIFVHGIQGHPFRTWALPGDPGAQAKPQKHKKHKKHFINRILRCFQAPPTLEGEHRANSTGKVSENDRVSDSSKNFHDPQSSKTFWPRDFLPEECPNARILTWGYESNVTGYTAGPVNKNSIFAHARNFLFELGRERDMDRPIIFVAHSLGGIIVKEMLANSDIDEDTGLKNIVASTAAVMFLATPHRGSKEMAGVGEVARRAAGILMADTSSSLLDALGLETSDLERSQHAFSRLWRAYDFRVKTFQEDTGLTRVNFGLLNEKVVPDISSELGDPREHVETLRGNHREICRMSGKEDPNYRPVTGELGRFYQSILMMGYSAAPVIQVKMLSSVEEACLNSLRFPSMDRRRQDIHEPCPGSCQWLFEHENYQNWLLRRDIKKHMGLIWIKGVPGSGKSTLINEAYKGLRTQHRDQYHTAAFFFQAGGCPEDRTPLGMFRSLLYQLLRYRQDELSHLTEVYQGKASQEDISGGTVWHETELRTFFKSMFERLSGVQTVIFLDALDECEPAGRRDIAYFFRNLTETVQAKGIPLSVCLSSTHFPYITVNRCLEITMESHNGPDISHYIDQKFGIDEASTSRNTVEKGCWNELKQKIIENSSGVFLWVELIVDLLLEDWDKGMNLTYMMKKVSYVPAKLQDRFRAILEYDMTDLQTSVRLFQWVILAQQPLRLREWYHILPFVRGGTLSCLREWRKSEMFAESDDQLVKQIRSISRGLVEVTSNFDLGQLHEDYYLNEGSRYAWAGSLDSRAGETRVVKVIHESVRNFFLAENGFSFLDRSLEDNPIVSGHLQIMNNCLDYIGIKELDSLVEARRALVQHSRGKRRHHRGSSVASFSSAASGLSIRNQSHSGSDMEGTRRLELSPEELNPMTESFEDFRISLLSRSPPEFWPDISPPSSSVHSLSSNRSRLLECYPALLHYTSMNFFVHARLVEEVGGDALSVMLKFRVKRSWERLLALREDISQDTKLVDYVTEQKLVSWKKYFSDYDDSMSLKSCSSLVSYDDADNGAIALGVQVRETAPRWPQKKGGTAASDTSLSSAGVVKPSSVVQRFSPSHTSSYRSHLRLSATSGDESKVIPAVPLKSPPLKQRTGSIFMLGDSSGDEESSFEDRFKTSPPRSPLKDGLQFKAKAGTTPVPAVADQEAAMNENAV